MGFTRGTPDKSPATPYLHLCQCQTAGHLKAKVLYWKKSEFQCLPVSHSHNAASVEHAVQRARSIQLHNQYKCTINPTARSIQLRDQLNVVRCAIDADGLQPWVLGAGCWYDTA